MVRGINLVGTPLAMFSEIEAVGGEVLQQPPLDLGLQQGRQNQGHAGQKEKKLEDLPPGAGPRHESRPEGTVREALGFTSRI